MAGSFRDVPRSGIARPTLLGAAGEQGNSSRRRPSARVAVGPAVAGDRPPRARGERLELPRALGPAPVVVLVAERGRALAGRAVAGEERGAAPARAAERAPLGEVDLPERHADLL